MIASLIFLEIAPCFRQCDVVGNKYSIPLIFTAGTAFAALSFGCANSSRSRTEAALRRQEAQMPAATSRDPLSYGMVTKTVKKGQTDQAEIMQLFGAPNVTSINKDGLEVWMYDRISSASHANGVSDADRFGVFFGIGTTGSGGNAYVSSSASSTTTLTVIITFDENKRVKDYSARSTRF